MRFKTFMETADEYRWATVKNIKFSTPAKWEHISGNYGTFYFDGDLKHTIGKRYKFKKTKDYTTLWWNSDVGLYYHPDWLDFGEEGDPIPLFPKD